MFEKTQVWRRTKILVVEDRYLLADLISNSLRGWGFEAVGPTGRLREACRLAGQRALDGALLDVNLGEGPCFPVCTILNARKIPFAFVTGYEDQSRIPSEFRGAPVVRKPFAEHELKGVLTQIVPFHEEPFSESQVREARARGSGASISQNSPEQVAYELLREIAFAEGKRLRGGRIGEKADRDYILRTYWDCWRVVQGVGTEELDDIHPEGTLEASRASLSEDRPGTAPRELGAVIDFRHPERRWKIDFE